MMAQVALWAALIAGAIVAALVAGALVNMLADRVVGVDEPIWSARQCRKCLEPLPLPSPFALRELFPPWRACPTCGRRVSLRRPITQLALVAAFLVALWRAGQRAAPTALSPTALSPTPAALPAWALWLLAALALTALAFTFVVDLEHRLIYDLAIYPPIGILLGATALADRRHLVQIVFAGVVGGLLFLLFYGLGWLLYREEALGFGDVKLAALVGVIVGWPGEITALLLTAVGAAVVSGLLLATGVAGRRTFIPLGVFLAVAGAVTLLTAPFPW